MNLHTRQPFRSGSRWRRWAGPALIGLLTASVLAATAPPAAGAGGPGPIYQPSAQNVTADALPTVQIDGVAWAQVVVGNTVYVGGSFATARPAGVPAGGAGQVARTDLLAYNLRTGVLIASFAPTLNGEVLALAASPDGSVIYAAGTFTTVDGVTHDRIAAFTASSGAVRTNFHVDLNASARALAATNATVYVGGLFTTANGVARSRLAAFGAAEGATPGVLAAWAPTADYAVRAMTLSPDGSRVIIGGSFTNLNSLPVFGMGAVSATTGASAAWAVNRIVRDYGQNAGITSLSTDGTTVYGTGFVFGPYGNFEGTFAANPSTGVLTWMEDCHGDTYSVFAVNHIVYTVSHAHFCANDGGWPVFNPWQYRHSVAFTAAVTGTLLTNSQANYPNFGGQPAPSIINWFPDYTTGTYTGQNQAAWTVSGNSQYIVEGGEFPTVNGVAQQGLVRFAVRPIAPAKSGPRVTGAHFTPTLSAVSTTSVRGRFAANWDRDDKTLYYRVVRNSNTAAPIWTTTADSEWWNLPTLTFTDSGLTPGATYRYRLYVHDGDGNTIAGDTVTITMPTV